MHTNGPTIDMTPEREDARALQLRLYRELGLSAVAEALAIAIPAESSASLFRRHTPATVLSEEKAA